MYLPVRSNNSSAKRLNSWRNDATSCCRSALSPLWLSWEGVAASCESVLHSLLDSNSMGGLQTIHFVDEVQQIFSQASVPIQTLKCRSAGRRIRARGRGRRSPTRAFSKSLHVALTFAHRLPVHLFRSTIFL